ncbi:type III pantothenate kinase [Echinimonas agarilytica]|uniref:Type III pantothenate kinase n=1 Tax=Echinimonas agarilytica TaxID=1215918 RepID=A0AA41W989_9GAMM|nr:type III pantothenate kinase [Echinimonas agarilytica]MCM2681454.1 type III pantothenate kinase [Echinimonas agarilytica]
MLLADLGNTRGKFCQLNDGAFGDQFHWNYDEPVAPLLEHCEGCTIVVAAVANETRKQALIDAALGLSIRLLWVETPKWDFDVINGYIEHRKLGVDRWLALVGARHLCRSPSVIIDAGTAITVDVLDEFGQHKGGWIAPGMQLMAEALLKNTANLMQYEEGHSVRLAHGTEAGISNGSLAAVVGLTLQALETARYALNTRISPQLILTGGAAEAIAHAIQVSARVEPNLVFYGLLQYAARTQKNAE